MANTLQRETTSVRVENLPALQGTGSLGSRGGGGKMEAFPFCPVIDIKLRKGIPSHAAE